MVIKDQMNTIVTKIDTPNRITLAKTEIIYPKNVGALVAMNFT